MTRIRAIAWDIDGTLIDSEPLHHRALIAACGAFGSDIRDIPEERFLGIHMGDVWTMLRPRLPAELAFDPWMAEIASYYGAHRHELALIDGAVEVVRAAAALGLRQACVSNSARLIVDANLDALGISDHIDFSISIDDVVAGKPDPEPYRTACLRLGLEPGEVVAVEDSRVGAASALAAGLHTVSFAPRTDLAARDAKRWAPHRVTRLADLPALLARL